MLQAGEVLDRFRIEATVAHTGMSTLYRATDLDSGQSVAIKVPHDNMKSDPVLMERFKREREIGSLIDHPGVAKTYEPAQCSRPYMVIEWVEGKLLRTILREEGRLPPGRAVHITLGICEALDAMHKQGIVHRDLKPENIMVGAGDQIKIIDFGIAIKEDSRRLTHVQMSPILGTPDYISPEQVQGRRGDQRSDIYSLGIMLYEMLTGQVPFSGPSPLAVMNDRLVQEAPPPSEINEDIPPELQEIVYRALARDPRHRYATASEMAWDLEHQDQVGVEDRGAHPVRKRPRSLAEKLNRRLLLYVGLALVPALIFALMLALAGRR